MLQSIKGVKKFHLKTALFCTICVAFCTQACCELAEKLKFFKLKAHTKACAQSNADGKCRKQMHLLAHIHSLTHNKKQNSI